jgi:hypothetical protein
VARDAAALHGRQFLEQAINAARVCGYEVSVTWGALSSTGEAMVSTTARSAIASRSCRTD